MKVANGQNNVIFEILIPNNAIAGQRNPWAKQLLFQDTGPSKIVQNGQKCIKMAAFHMTKLNLKRILPSKKGSIILHLDSACAQNPNNSINQLISTKEFSVPSRKPQLSNSSPIFGSFCLNNALKGAKMAQHKPCKISLSPHRINVDVG